MAFSLLLLSVGCSARPEGFAIYLTAANIPPAQMIIQSHVELAENPIISLDDIVSYNSATHEIELTVAAFERISRLEVPVHGTSFMVCVDRGPIYSGAFWTLLSSVSYDGVTIVQPLGEHQKTIIQLELGYPSPAFFEYADPRGNAEVLHSLAEAGKLPE